MKKIIKNKKGITLIALIITIVVMLILAGVAINLTIGEDGIFATAKKAAKEYTDVQNNELADLNEFNNTINNIINGNVAEEAPEIKEWSEPYTTTTKYNYTDTEGNKASIPAGFQVSLKPGETKVNEGLVIRNANDKNEFVWIPVEGMGYTYNRYDFGKQTGVYSEYIEAMPSDEQTSVTTYGGYYIGRYEAGIASATARTVANESETAEEIEATWGKALSQEEKHIYSYITRDQAKGLAERVYTKAKDNVTSKLCSSYAWDTALKFIETKYPEYPTYSEGGNYNTESGGTEILQKTGYHSVNNIYDMGGNAWNWTTEVYSDGNGIIRGGSYDVSTSIYAASRDIVLVNGTGTNVGFRVALFI